MLVAVVNENADFFGAQLLRTETEDEEQRVDDVRLAAAVGADHSIEALFE